MAVRLLCALLAIGTPQVLAAQQQPVLASAAMRLELSGTDGHVLALRDGRGRALGGGATDSAGIWSLDLKPGWGAPAIRASQAGRFTWRRSGANRLELVWDRFAGTAALTLRVAATVVMLPDTTLIWHISLAGIRGIPVDRVNFPRITGIATHGSGQELAVPAWMGQVARDPRALLAPGNTPSKRLEFVYPGSLSMQMISLSSERSGGLYFAADDSLSFRKSFLLWGASDGSAGYAMVHMPSNPGESDTYAPPYAAIVGIVPGDWLTAIQRYRKWGVRQSWARNSRLATGATPAWLRDTGIWEWNRGRSDVVLEPAAALQKDAQLPVSVFWHWWHNGPYDTSFPDYLPPREGADKFTGAVKTAHGAGLHAIVYMNQRLWCVNTPSWKAEGAEKWAVHERDGTLRLETYNVFNPLPCATMDIATPFWRNKYAGIADTVIKQYGLDGIYMDQAVLSLVDWSADHGHPVGGGNYWMNGFRELANDLRKRKGSRATAFAGEGGGEGWMPYLDAFLTLQVSRERYSDPASGWEVIPMFQAAYHPYALTYGTYGSLTLPPYDELWPVEKRPATAMTLLDSKYVRQFYLEQARMFVWGMQPTIANFLPDQLTARRTEIDYLERLARLRYGLREYFLSGTYLRPPVVDVQSSDILLSRISIYAARLGGPIEAHINSPEVLSSAWRSPDGRVAVALASISTKALNPRVRLPANAYGLPAGSRIIRHDRSGKHPLGMLAALGETFDVSMNPLDGVVLEFIPPSRAGR
ncbi:MAG TPA: DUF6259 domain-containing protein [Gemmatimonadaceae bacterium]|nr:DUF6259 domain-containing protein [Gemmatimonadaceae bacterium]